MRRSGAPARLPGPRAEAAPEPGHDSNQRRSVPPQRLAGPLFLETAIVPPAALEPVRLDAVVRSLTEALPRFDTLPFETLEGEFEPQPFQLVGPLEEFPQVAPVRYLLITHWPDAATLAAWQDSAEYRALGELGEVSSQVSALIRHRPGERNGLNADGSARGWARQAATV